MSRNGNSKDLSVLVTLVSFCALMTFLLVRSEYFPESSPLHRLPPRFVGERFLHHESSSALKVVWKGEDIGSVSIRVTPTTFTALNTSIRLEIPILGKRPKFQMEMDARLKPTHDLQRLRLHGSVEGVNFEVTADSESDRVQINAQGGGVDEKREFKMSDLTENGGRALLSQFPEIPKGALQSPENLKSMQDNIQLHAMSTRVDRLGEWMDAYMVEGRLDANTWVKLWMSPTGEILKLDSSFGLTAINEDFFEGLESKENELKKPEVRNQSSSSKLFFEAVLFPSKPSCSPFWILTPDS